MTLCVCAFQSAYAVPTMAFSFLCHTAVLPIYCELHRLVHSLLFFLCICRIYSLLLPNYMFMYVFQTHKAENAESGECQHLS